MNKIALIGPAGKGPVGTPIYVKTLKELVDNFGSHSNLVSTAQQLLFSGYAPLIVRVAGLHALQLPYINIEDKNKKICMAISADSPGSEGLLTSVDVSHNEDGTFDLEVYNSGHRVEYWGNLNLNSAQESINLASKWINLKIFNNSIPPEKLYQLKYDQNLFSDKDGEDIYLEGVKVLEGFDLEFIALPGCSSIKTINKVIEHCEENDRILVIDSPMHYKLLETYKWCKYLTPSDHAMVIWPWVLSNKTYVPSSGVILANLINWPTIWQPSKARLNGIAGTEFEAFKDELSYISQEKHTLNLIKRNPDSILNNVLRTLGGERVSRRRLLASVKRDIKKMTMDLLERYKPTDAAFRNKFIGSAEYILNQIREEQGINNFFVQVNELTKAKEFCVSIGVQLIDTLEFINIEFKFLDIGDK